MACFASKWRTKLSACSTTAAARGSLSLRSDINTSPTGRCALPARLRRQARGRGGRSTLSVEAALHRKRQRPGHDRMTRPSGVMANSVNQSRAVHTFQQHDRRIEQFDRPLCCSVDFHFKFLDVCHGGKPHSRGAFPYRRPIDVVLVAVEVSPV